MTNVEQLRRILEAAPPTPTPLLPRIAVLRSPRIGIAR